MSAMITSITRFIIALLFTTTLTVYAAETTALISDHTAQQYGLSRDWFHKIMFDADNDEVLFVRLEGNTLFVVSSNASITALDSATGHLRWKRRIGERSQITYAPGVNSRMVAVINGTTVNVLDRRDGKLVWQAKLDDTPGAGCELSESYVYIPLMSGRIVAYCLEDKITSEADAKETAAKPVTAGETGTKPAAAKTEEEDEDMKAIENIKKSFEESKRLTSPKRVRETPEEAIQLEAGSVIPLVAQTFGHIWLQPNVCTQKLRYDVVGTEETAKEILVGHSELVAWTTDIGALFVGSVENFSKDTLLLRYRVNISPRSYFMNSSRITEYETKNKENIVARPTFCHANPPALPDGQKPERSSRLLVGTQAGYVFAIEDLSSQVIWRFAANGAIDNEVANIGDMVFACSRGGGMHAIGMNDGKEIWYSPKITNFVAASETRVYTIDTQQQLTILDRATGARVKSMSARDYHFRYFNDETNQIILVTKDGLVQCLSEWQESDDDTVKAKEIKRYKPTCEEYLEALKIAGGKKAAPKQRKQKVKGTDDDPFGESETETDESMPNEENSGDDPFG
ncbi:MAG: PQQ-binding-like beta-propeller repeat protein [Planctomycetaceae bacterium]|jgi:outer membrane protein assembly factor BamB|nr:PQQ-binding-like beta-propeller repeat protein [Planctomycetaceae bacterium]